MEDDIPKLTSNSVSLVVILVMMCHVIRFHHINHAESTCPVMEKVVAEIVGDVGSDRTGVERIQILLTGKGTDEEVRTDGEDNEKGRRHDESHPIHR